MLKQQAQIYNVPPKRGANNPTGPVGIGVWAPGGGEEVASPQELELWESCHTELGCLYVELTQRHL